MSTMSSALPGDQTFSSSRACLATILQCKTLNGPAALAAQERVEGHKRLSCACLWLLELIRVQGHRLEVSGNSLSCHGTHTHKDVRHPGGRLHEGFQ